MNLTAKENFEAYYSFMDFVEATGLKAPAVGKAYTEFRDFTFEYIKTAGLDAISEAFEVWNRERNCEETYACEDCKQYSNHRCKLWQVVINKPDDSHCESFQR